MGVNGQDSSAVPRRYMQRQWKKNKPHLNPSDSLPTLRLCPNRPLFLCAQCGFSNAWIPLCLWCEWTSAEATKQFEANMPRPRRLSAPSRAVPAANKAKQRPRRKTTADCCGAPSTRSHAPQSEQTNHPAKGVPDVTTLLEAFRNCQDNRCADPRNVGDDMTESLPIASTSSLDVQKETVEDGGVRRVIIATSITPPLPTSSFPNGTPERGIDSSKHNSEDQEQLRRNSRRQWRKLPAALCVYPSTKRFFRSSRCSASAERTNVAMDSAPSVLMDASGTPRSTGSLDMWDGRRMHSTHSVSSSHSSPRRGLRSAKNMTSLKRESSVSYRSRSPLRESMDIYPTSTMEARQSQVLSLTSSLQDQDSPPVRLGHPSRPYYSAIRKDMSRPTSPVFSMTAPRTPSPISSHADYIPRGTKSLDCGDRSGHPHMRELRPMSMVMPGQATPPKPSSGFSLSGEMELRINLARWRRENTPDEPGGYHFEETSPSRTRVNVKKRVKQFGKGLKELMRGRS